MMIVADTCWATELSFFLLFLRKTMTAGSTSRNIGEEKICQDRIDEVVNEVHWINKMNWINKMHWINE